MSEEKLTKIINLLMSTESEGEAMQCWRAARALVPTGRLMDHLQEASPKLDDPVFIDDIIAEMEAKERADINRRAQMNRAKRAELKLREKELLIREREVAVMRALREMAAM